MNDHDAFDLEAIDRLISTSPTGEMPAIDDSTPPPRTRQPQAPLRVALVDDNTFTRGFMESYLLRRGVEVIASADGHVDPTALQSVSALIVSGHLSGPGPRAVIERLSRARSVDVIVTVRSDIGEGWRDWGIRELVPVTSNLGRLGELLDEIRSERVTPQTTLVDTAAVLALATHDPDLMLDTIELFIGQFPEWHAALETSISNGDSGGARLACKQIEDAVGLLGAKSLGHHASVVRTLIEGGEISTVGGFVARMEAEYATAFRELLTVRAQIEQQRN